MKKLFTSFQALEKQYETAVDNHTVVLAELESGNLNDEKLDAKIVEASKHSTRSAELKKIKDQGLFGTKIVPISSRIPIVSQSYRV